MQITHALRSFFHQMSLFPKNVRDRLFAEKGQDDKKKKDEFNSPNMNGDSVYELSDNRPNADLFPETTIMFGDIAGMLLRACCVPEYLHPY